MTQKPFFPPEALGASPRVVLYGRARLLIEQHHGVIGYTRERLTVRLDNGYILINGHDLSIAEYGVRDIVVSGQIDGVAFT